MDDALNRLITDDFDNLSEEQAKELLRHLRKQFKERYFYLIGEWQNDHRAKSTRNGKFVSKEEVMKYLEKKEV